MSTGQSRPYGARSAVTCAGVPDSVFSMHCLAVAALKFPGVEPYHKFGRNAAVGTGQEDIWPNGGDYPFQIAEVELEVVSTSDDDTDSASSTVGARKILITNLLNAGCVRLPDVVVSMDGMTPVAVPGGAAYFRCSRAWVSEARGYEGPAGEPQVNAGDISIQVAGGGDVLAVIPAGIGQTEMAIDTVPAGFDLYILDVRTSTNDVDMLFRMFKRENADQVTEPFTAWREVSFGLGEISEALANVPIQPPIRIEEKTDVRMTADPPGGTGNDASAAFCGILIPRSAQ